MDTLGTLSMVFEISFLLGGGDSWMAILIDKRRGETMGNEEVPCFVTVVDATPLQIEGPKRFRIKDAVHAVLLRSARAAKLGARAGRIFKLVMCYSLLIRGPEGEEQKRDT